MEPSEPKHLSDLSLLETELRGDPAKLRNYIENEWPKYVESERRKTMREMVELFFGHGIVDTDWDHPDLQKNRKAIDYVRSWTPSSRGLLMSGETGTGKTRALASLVMRLADEGVELVIRHSQGLMADISLHQSYGRDDAEGLIETLGSREVLVIEDLGQEATFRSKDEQNRQWFFRLLDLRYANGRPCLITTNHTAKSLAQSVRQVSSDPLIRRLLAVAEPVRFN